MNLHRFVIIAVLLVLPITAYTDSFTDAQKDYIYGDYQDSIAKLQRFQGNFQAVYLLGLNSMKMGDYPAARNYFSKIINSSSKAPLHDQAALKFIDTYFLEKDYSKAKDQYKRLLSSSGANNYLSLIYLRLAQIASKEGNWAEKKSYLEKIKTKFPQSAEMKYVGVLEGYGNYYTVQVGAFGSMDNAQAIKRDLSSRNDVYVIKEAKGVVNIYKVRVGRFVERADAEKLAARLVDDGYPAIVFP